MEVSLSFLMVFVFVGGGVCEEGQVGKRVNGMASEVGRVRIMSYTCFDDIARSRAF